MIGLMRMEILHGTLAPLDDDIHEGRCPVAHASLFTRYLRYLMLQCTKSSFKVTDLQGRSVPAIYLDAKPRAAL